MLLEEESLLKKDARPSQGRIQAYGEELAGTEQKYDQGSCSGRGTWSWKVTHRKAIKGPSPPGPAFYFHRHLTEAQLSHPGCRSCSTFFFFAKQQPVLEEEDSDPLEF